MLSYLPNLIAMAVLPGSLRFQLYHQEQKTSKSLNHLILCILFWYFIWELWGVKYTP